MEPTIVENLSRQAGSFAERYSHEPNFMQRYKVWTAAIDKYSNGAASAYDMGCGSGIFSVYLASKGIRTTGFDAAKGMIELAEKAQQERQLPGLEFKLDTIPITGREHLPKVDLIISSSVIEYIENVDATIEMFHDLLKPNGKLIVSFPNKDAIYRKLEMGMFRVFGIPGYFRFVKNIWNKTEAEKQFAKAGFKRVEHFYFSDRSLVSKLAGLAGGKRRAGNLTLMVFEKQK